ncbi:uncharacterized protein MICPUCDRAFT_56105 [Micromonas pusilla CCMP1545]|jgi:hypothetical protein|uniref:Predicted protein n=2 Tax=Micromonas pusilla TaxID=38833 RepID=C1MP13_MICPC|nr:uncharacterized protein MICPUCDRAFT_56105 [Micromonas pusilla CCMP1545]EEH58386.1 predicted protein [Micromonas pusilla CCMP1545]|eukprot:XP_003056741.1 predicted protein [Micromonas pusilla CCMP1545]
MCPMRWVLLLFSGIIAGYLAWTSSWFSASGEDVGEAPRGGDEGARRGRATADGGVASWARFAIDGLSGRYLYMMLHASRKDAAGKGGAEGGRITRSRSKKTS